MRSRRGCSRWRRATLPRSRVASSARWRCRGSSICSTATGCRRRSSSGPYRARLSRPRSADPALQVTSSATTAGCTKGSRRWRRRRSASTSCAASTRSTESPAFARGLPRAGRRRQRQHRRAPARARVLYDASFSGLRLRAVLPAERRSVPARRGVRLRREHDLVGIPFSWGLSDFQYFEFVPGHHGSPGHAVGRLRDLARRARAGRTRTSRAASST